MQNSAAALLQEAVLLHRQGALAEAVRRYDEILRLDPANADALYYMAMASCQQGRFAEGVDVARRAIAAAPQQARAHNLLGMALSRLGRNGDALSSFDAAIGCEPDFAEAHGNRANALSELGRIEDAVASYERAVTLAPSSVGDWINLGAAQHQLGRHEQAIASYDRAIALQADVPEAHFNRGNVLTHLNRHAEALATFDAMLALGVRNADVLNNRGNVLVKLGRPDEALASFDEALGLTPDHVGALINRGIALKNVGRFDEAVAAYHSALALKPDSADAHYNLANVLTAQGDAVGALAAVVNALNIRDSAEARALFVQCVRGRRLTFDPGTVRPLMLRALTEPWDRPADLAIPAVSLVKLNPVIKDNCERAAAAWPVRIMPEGLAGRPTAIAEDQLLQALLETVPVCDVELERLLTSLRVILLGAAASGTSDNAMLAFHCALARQCFINEYVFDVTARELNAVRQLRQRLTEDAAAGREIAPHLIAAIASYEPLHSMPSVESLLDKPWPAPLAALLTQQVREPLEEQRLRQSIPSLTAIADDVSLKVKQQYEENPYPRWIKPAPVQPKTLAEYLGSRIPVPGLGPRGAVEILIAGCGTGQNLVEVAREIAGAEVTAIDLSLASLAYAKRQATALGLNNVTFATADILNLESVGRMFDLIDASGVLHHLADPWAAWRVLLTLLRPGGLMRVGLYSKPGRSIVNAARAFVAERGFPATVEGIRRSRQAILALDEQSPVRPVANYPDFFTTSECRDMLFHVQEHQLTLPEISGFLAENDLELVGLQVEPHVLQKFATQHADPAALTDLGLWHKFETENPAAFAGMYQFWIRRK